MSSGVDWKKKLAIGKPSIWRKENSGIRFDSPARTALRKASPLKMPGEGAEKLNPSIMTGSVL